MTLLPVPRNCCHAIISLRRFSKAVRRLYAASALSLITCANAASVISRGNEVWSPAQSLKLDRKPCTVTPFVDDLLAVLKAFAAMAGAYCSLRVGKGAWSDFVDDLDRKKAISVSPKDVW
jgi:hypothetical protein